jgi:uncharacterized small protein (DUF1192 family)
MSSDIKGRLMSACNDKDNMPRMSTELVRALRVFDVTETVNTIEALEGEVARWKREVKAATDIRVEAEARVERLRVALEDAIETMELAERIPFIDPDYGQQIEALGRRIGFGALMTSASASWAKVNAEMGLPAGGHFVAAPCHASVVQSLNKMRKALEDDKQ